MDKQEEQTLKLVVKNVSLEEIEQAVICVKHDLADKPEGKITLQLLVGAMVLKREQCLVQLRLFD